MYILLKYFILSYVFGAIWMCRVGGNITVKLNKFFILFFMIGIDKLLNEVFSLEVQKNKYSLLGVLWQVFSILFFMVIPIMIKCLNNNLPINIATCYIELFKIFNIYGWIIYIIFGIDALIYYSRKKH